MKKQFLKFGVLTLLAAAMSVSPIRVTAADAEKPVVKPPVAEKPIPPARSVPFRGKLAAVDKTLMTFTVGERVFQVTSQTKISKGGKPGILEDGVVGENVTGAYKKGEDGKLTATTVNFATTPAAGAAATTGEKPKDKLPGAAN
jgi:hypothetical protein